MKKRKRDMQARLGSLAGGLDGLLAEGLPQRVRALEDWRAEVNLARVQDGRERLERLESLLAVQRDEFGAWGAGAVGDLHERIRRLEAASHSPEDVTGAISGLRGGRDALLGRVSHLENRVNRRRDEITGLAHDLRQAEERLTEAQDAHESRIKLLEEAQPGAETDKLRADHEALEPAHQAMMRERDNVRTELALVAAQRDTLLNDLSRARSQCDDAKAEALDACSLRDKAISERDKARAGLKTVFDHADRIDALESALAKIEAAESMAEVRRLARAELGKVA